MLTKTSEDKLPETTLEKYTPTLLQRKGCVSRSLLPRTLAKRAHGKLCHHLRVIAGGDRASLPPARARAVHHLGWTVRQQEKTKTNVSKRKKTIKNTTHAREERYRVMPLGNCRTDTKIKRRAITRAHAWQNTI